MFQVGDWVKCIDNKEGVYEDRLEVGKIYQVREVMYPKADGECIRLVGEGAMGPFSKRFVPAAGPNDSPMLDSQEYEDIILAEEAYASVKRRGRRG